MLPLRYDRAGTLGSNEPSHLSKIPTIAIDNLCSLATLVGMEIECYLKIDRDEGIVTWCDKIIGLIEELEPGEISQTVSMFVEQYDFRVNGFTQTEIPNAATISEIEDVLSIGYFLKPRREDWPGRRGI